MRPAIDRRVLALFVVVGVLGAAALINTTRAASDAVATVAGTLRAVALSARAPSAAELGCPDTPGGVVTQEFAAAIDRRALAPGVVLSWRCVDGAGHRHPSLVQVVRPGSQGGPPVVLATLIQTAQDLRAQQITAGSGAVRVLASYWDTRARGCCSAAPAQGTVSILDFAPARRDGRAPWTFVSSSPVAKACGPADLTASVIRGAARVGETASLRFVNTGRTACAIEGYPSVLAHTAQGYPRAAAPALSGLSGGVRQDTVAPMVLLQPTDLATAVIESLPSTYGGCATSTSLEVSLPAAGEIAQLNFAMGLCEAQVHPVTAGASGWSG